MNHPPVGVRRGQPAVFWVCFLASGSLCAVRFGMWKLSDVMMEIVFVPFLLLGLVLGLISGVWALVHLIRRIRLEGRFALIPLGTLLLGGLIAFVLIPGSELSEQESYWRYRWDRDAVIRMVKSHQLNVVPGSPRAGKLPWLYRHVSDGGEIFVEQPDGNTRVVFYTFRGLLTGGSRGILYTQDDVPSTTTLGPQTEIGKLADHWYWFVTDD